MFVRCTKMRWVGVLLILLGIMSYVAEQVFYGGTIDENGVVQESFFLPLALLLGFLGLIVLVISLFKKRQ